ncbi:myosin phosphatase Rho-interacting protein [Enoplosus armatus]|uniref:myosin phosphatase Rho-interacting protein n=1 Tax=Enoplosus armatus TaxID=215367 RepID=UPI003992F3C3
MSFKDNPCRKFQANIFNKSKCQNCFKPRESHLLNDEDLNQAKPIYGGWLLLAPEGTNFDNPLHRSRKWQRRFFILYEHGLLRYALDEMPSTLPQGTINMNQCSDVVDGESRTGQKNSLCILTPEKEHFIRAECKEIINGWQEALTVYPRTNKQNQKKKRKVDPPTHQEPGPAKVTVTSSSSGGSIPCLPSSIASAERVPMSRATLWQEESRWSRATIPCSRSASCLSQLGQSQPESSITTQDDGGTMSTGRKVRVESGYFSLEKTKSEPSPQSAQHSQPLQPPQHLPLSSSASSSSLGALSPSYSTISSSQSSLDSEPSGTTPTWEGHSGGGGSTGSVSGGGGRVGRSGREYAALSDVPRARRLNYREAFRSEKKRQELRARTRSPGREEVARLFGEERRRSQIIGRFEEGPHVERMDTSSSNEPSTNTTLVQRQGRSERRYLANKHMSLDSGKDRSVPDVSSSTFANLRRAKSLDRRVTESSMTPDLLNFKKGWMTKLYEDGMWKKHWFVLTDQSLRYYKDSIAEEASELDGEIDLSTCYDVKEFPVQRNYGFQILCKEGACTLSAMTSGIRRNWIQAIMKNVRPTIAPDVTRSLPEEKVKTQVMLEPCTQATPEPSPRPEAPKSDVHRQPAGNNAPPSEPRKSRVRERRREGRSKTFDWSEFKMEQSEKPVKERADTVDLSSSFSTTSSYCSPSSSPSSLASSPVSTSSLQTSSVSGAHPPSMTEEAEKENVRRGIPPHSTTGATHMPNTVTVTMTSTLNTAPPVQPPVPECQEQGRMEVDHPAAMQPASGDKKDNRTSDVQEEIEHRWHQVETTPLREEKQVPINTALGNSGNSDRLPAHELAALLDKELGQKQMELDRLQKQNNVLKEQLEDALGREQSAREGYVLQSATPPSSSPRRVPWQRLHSLNQDLQGELEAQKRKQDLAQQHIRTLKRSYTEAQDAVDRHEADIQALQAKLASAMAEILASEQAVARMRNELKLEQERSKEQDQEYSRSETTLRAQLKDSEDRLREVEASLLERNQALRHLERQQALQRDHMREIQRLQERLQEVTARLSATEEGQALKEERLRKEQHSMQESHERERQTLCRRLAEAETAQKEMENRLLEAEQQVEALLRGRQASGGKESREEMLKLQEELAQKTDMVESLRESVRRLEEEKGHLTCRCQELLNQIAEADREVTKLRNRLETEEADYYTLEHSYERATQEFQKMSQFLREKEEEIRQTKEMYERLVERKEEDLKEALVKMTALGNSLEETEQKLQAKEELLCQMSQSLLDKVEPCSAEKDLQAKLVVAEDRIAELEQHLNALQLGYADLPLIQAQVAYVACRLRAMHEQDMGWGKQTGQNMDALVQQHARNVNVIQEKYEASLQEERLNFTQTVATIRKENQTLKSEISKRVNQLSQQQEQLALLEEHFQKETEELKQRHKQELSQAEKGRASIELALMETTADSQRKLEVLMVDMDTMEERHESHVRKLEEQFEQRICELQHIHKEEIEKLHSQYMESIKRVQEYQLDKKGPDVFHSPPCDETTTPMEEEEQGKGEEAQNMSEVDSMVVLKDRIQELETQMNTMRDELENKHLEGDVASLREKYQRDFESLKATCERGFAAMEETHHKVIQDLQRQHQREISKLMEERERLLAEETAATIAAIEAMKNAHKEEMEKTHRSQLSGLNSDIDELRLQYEEELQSIHRELEVLSEQYSQKCLENAHLAQALEAERQALRQCQRENQELNTHNQELNNRLTAEITRMRSCFSGETALSPLTQGKDVYELEVLLRIKESEIQYLKQEIHSLKDELQSALRDKKYATDKYKDIYTELSIVKAKADCDISKLKEKLLIATEALGERTVDGTVTSGYDIMKSKSNPDFLKRQSKQSRGVRSKSLKEGLTVQERMKLFEAKDSKKI